MPRTSFAPVQGRRAIWFASGNMAVVILLLLCVWSPLQTVALSYYICNQTAIDSVNEAFRCSNADGCSFCFDINENPVGDQLLTANCGGPCLPSDTVLAVEWRLPSVFCNGSCDTLTPELYQPCTSDASCPTGYCCSLPRPEVYLAPSSLVSCGLPSACGCADGFDGVVCDSDCNLNLAEGLCLPESASDALPGYSCTNDICADDISRVYKACGFDGDVTWNVHKACSPLCHNLVETLANSECANDPRVRLLTLGWPFTQCQGCSSYLYERCTNNNDCSPGRCCSFPPDKSLALGPPSDNKSYGSCGWPSLCKCDEFQGGKSISCSKDCPDVGRFGLCLDIGGQSDLGYTCPICPTDLNKAEYRTEVDKSAAFAWTSTTTLMLLILLL